MKPRDVLVATRLAEGVPQREIAAEAGVSQQYVSCLKRRDDIKVIIEKAHEKLIKSSLGASVENIDHVVKNYRTTTDEAEKEHGFKASVKVLEAAGLLSSHSQSVVHQTYINQQTNVTNPVIDALISKHLAGFALDRPVWEIEAEAVEE